MPCVVYWLGVNLSNPSRPPVDFPLLQRQKQINRHIYPNKVATLLVLKPASKQVIIQHCISTADKVHVQLGRGLDYDCPLLCLIICLTWFFDNLKVTFLIFSSFRLRARTHSSRHEKSYQISSSPGTSERLPVVVFVSCLGSKRLDVSEEVCM